MAPKRKQSSPVFTRQKLIILALILFNSSVTLSREFPFFSWQGKFNEEMNGYVHFFGLDQSYTVFAPPPEYNLHFFAVVTRQSGLMELWQYPRMDDLNLWDKLVKERYRKFLNDNLSLQALREHLVPLAQYIAKQHRLEGDEPHLVSIYAVLRPIRLPPSPVSNQQEPPADEYNPTYKRRVHLDAAARQPVKDGVFCLDTYVVRSEDLK